MADTKNQELEPNFCDQCGLSLVKLESWHSSQNCKTCGKEVYFVRPGENGGVKIEKGDKFHIPQLTLSLDPSKGGQFSRYGLERFIKSTFLEQKISDKDFVAKIKEVEIRIDEELMNLDCINHCDLSTDEGCSDALKILEKEKLFEYSYSLLRSSSLRACYTAIESNKALEASFAYYHAAIFQAYSILEQHDFKEIIWLGYCCYIDLVKNEKATYETSKQQTLINKLKPKVSSLNDDFLYALVNDGNEIAPRLSIQGLPENTLKTILEHEQNIRKSNKDQVYKDQEIAIKKKANSIKIFGTIFTLLNGLILILYKDWL